MEGTVSPLKTTSIFRFPVGLLRELRSWRVSSNSNNNGSGDEKVLVGKRACGGRLIYLLLPGVNNCSVCKSAFLVLWSAVLVSNHISSRNTLTTSSRIQARHWSHIRQVIKEIKRCLLVLGAVVHALHLGRAPVHNHHSKLTALIHNR